MIPSAPAAAAASDSGGTSSRRPAAWLGSTITGRCVSSLRIGTAIRSSVTRRWSVSKVRIPRSHSITARLPSLRMYSAAISSSSSGADRPRLSSPGVPHDARRLQGDLARFHRAGAGDHGEVLAPDLAPVDLEHRAFAVRHLRRGELVGLEDRHHAIDTRLSLETEALDARVLLHVA